MGFPILEYDGMVSVWAASMEDLMAVLQDAEYQRVVVPDAKVFSKTDESKVMIGYDKDFVVEGGKKGLWIDVDAMAMATGIRDGINR